MHAEIKEQPVPLERTSCEGLPLAARCFRVSFHLTITAKSAQRKIKGRNATIFRFRIVSAASPPEQTPIISHSVPLQRFLSLLWLRTPDHTQPKVGENLFVFWARNK